MKRIWKRGFPINVLICGTIIGATVVLVTIWISLRYYSSHSTSVDLKMKYGWVKL